MSAPDMWLLTGLAKIAAEIIIAMFWTLAVFSVGFIMLYGIAVFFGL